MIFEVREHRLRDCMGMLVTEQNLAKRLIHPSELSFLRDTENQRENNYFQQNYYYLHNRGNGLRVPSIRSCAYHQKKPVSLIKKPNIFNRSQNSDF